MNRKKYLLLFWMLIALACAGGVIYAGGRVLLLRRALALRSDGLAAATAGDDVRACDLLLEYIHRRPRDTDTIKTYIQCRRRVPMTGGQQYADTIEVVKILLQQDPTLIDDQRYLLELYVALERGPEAIDIADAILAKLPNDARTLEWKTKALIQQRRYQEALQVAVRWAAASPDDLQAHMNRLSLSFQLGRPPETLIADAQSLVKSHPGDARFEVLQAFTYARAGDNLHAIQWLQTAAKHPDLSDDITKIVVEQFDSLGENGAAFSLLQDRINHGAAPELRHLLAQRFWEQKQWKESADALNDVNPSDSRVDVTLLALKAISLAHVGRNADAAACLKSLAAGSQPDKIAWAALLHHVVEGTNIDYKALAEDCRAAGAFNPQDPYLAYFLGDAEVQLGEIDLAISAFGRAGALDNHWNEPAIRLVDCLLATGQPEQAHDVAWIIANRKPLDAGAAITLAQAWAADIENGQPGQADKLLDFVSKIQSRLSGENSALPLVKVQILAQQGKKDEAIQAARQAISGTPPPPEQVFRLVAAISRRYGLGMEAETFAAWGRTGVTSSLAYQQAIGEQAAGRSQAGLELFDRLAKQSGKSGDVDWRLARTQYLDMSGDPGAKAAWTALCDAFAGDLKVQQAALNGRSVRGDWQFMQQVIDRLHALTGDNALSWRLAKLNLMINSARSEDDYEKGSVELNSLIGGYPQLAQPHVLLAQALVHMDRLEGAIEQMTIATKLDPTSVPFSLQLVSLLQMHGDSDKAAQELDRIAQQPLTSVQRQEVAILLSKQGDPGHAVEVLQRQSPFPSATTEPVQDDNQQLLLAVLYRQQHQTDKAEAIVRDLLHRPTLPVIQFAASLFAADGRLAEARQAMALLDLLALAPGGKEMVWGDFYENQLHDLPEAARYFAAATKQATNNLNTWKALAICQAAQGQAADAVATMDAAYAAIPGDAGLATLKQQRQLLLDAGAYDGLRSVVISVLNNPQNSAVDLDLLRNVVNSHRDNKLEELAAALKQLADKNPNYAPAQIQLIQVYLDMGRAADAVAAAQRAMVAFPKDPAPAQAAVQAASAAGQYQDMELAARNWKARDANMAEAADTAAADAENHSRNFASALNTLQPYLPALKADPEHHALVMWNYVVASAGAGNIQDASDILWPFALKSPIGRQQWIQLAMNQLEPAQARDWLKQVEPIIPAGAILERCGLAQAYDGLGRRANDSQLIQDSMERYKALAADPKADATVVLTAGAEAERCGDLADAEIFYRRAIAMDPTLWIAENNLAMVIINRGENPQEAEQFAMAAIKSEPHKAELYDTLGEVQARAGDRAAAAQTMRLAIQLQPDVLMWRVRLARYLLDAGNLTEASQAVFAIDSDFPDLRGQDIDLQKQLADIRKQIHG